MKIIASKLMQKRVLSREGRHLGEVTDLELDTESWSVPRLAVRLRREVLKELEMSRPLIGTHTVWLPATLVEGMADALMLRINVADLELGEAGKESQTDEESHTHREEERPAP